MNHVKRRRSGGRRSSEIKLPATAKSNAAANARSQPSRRRRLRPALRFHERRSLIPFAFCLNTGRTLAPAKTESLLARLETLHPKSIDLSLGRVERLLDALGAPHRRIPPVVHVAGTNGKGSVVAFLKGILEAAGYRAHAFISPHLRRFHERIMLAGKGGARPIGERHLADILSRAEAANRGEPITFFEITTAAAFLAFAENPADILLLETGLGGRLDATNVVESPLATVLTPISLDHCAFLGGTIEAIAAEKAGILKRGRPVIVSRQSEPALRVIEARARALARRSLRAGKAGTCSSSMAG